MSDDKAKGHCRVCDGEYTLTKNGRIRSHGGCPGGSDLPREAAEQPVPKTASGGPNPHRAPLPVDGRPAIPVTSARVTAGDGEPVELANAVMRVIDPRCDQCNYDTHRCPGCGDDVPHGTIVCADCEVFHGLEPEHVHRFEYGDDGHGHAGAFCSCGLEEPTRPTADDHWGARAKQLVREGASPFDAAAILDHEMEMARAQPDSDADAAGFLGTGEPSDEELAADFFNSEELEQAPSKGRWFPSKYDGSCDVCGAFFDPGEEIRADGDGGWQGRECCGQAEDDGEEKPEQTTRPRRVGPKPPLRRGRYRLPHPEKGKPASFTRVTTFTKGASDHTALTKWELRSALVGLSRQPELLAQITGLDVKADRDRLNDLAELAKNAAGAKDKASVGTKLHKWTEEVDSERLTLDQVPDEFRAAVRRYRDVVEASGYRVVGHLIERTTVVAELDVVGTFDQVWQHIETGVYRIVDKKSGALTYDDTRREVEAQLSIYAKGANRHGVAEWDPALGDADDEKAWVWRPLTDEDGTVISVDEAVGIVVHMPQGGEEITLYEVDLTSGWAHAKLCADVRARHRVKPVMTVVELKLPARPAEPAADAGSALLARVVPQRPSFSLASPAPVPADFGAPASVAEEVPARPLTWAERFAAVASKEAAFELLKEARDAGMPKARQDELVLVAKAALAA